MKRRSKRIQSNSNEAVCKTEKTGKELIGKSNFHQGLRHHQRVLLKVFNVYLEKCVPYSALIHVKCLVHQIQKFQKLKNCSLLELQEIQISRNQFEIKMKNLVTNYFLLQRHKGRLIYLPFLCQMEQNDVIIQLQMTEQNISDEKLMQLLIQSQKQIQINQKVLQANCRAMDQFIKRNQIELQQMRDQLAELFKPKKPLQEMIKMMKNCWGFCREQLTSKQAASKSVSLEKIEAQRTSNKSIELQNDQEPQSEMLLKSN